jgi:hypothetical protein
VKELRIRRRSVANGRKTLERRVVRRFLVVVPSSDHATGDEERAVGETSRRGVPAGASETDSARILVNIAVVVLARIEETNTHQPVCEKRVSVSQSRHGKEKQRTVGLVIDAANGRKSARCGEEDDNERRTRSVGGSHRG